LFLAIVSKRSVTVAPQTPSRLVFGSIVPTRVALLATECTTTLALLGVMPPKVLPVVGSLERAIVFAAAFNAFMMETEEDETVVTPTAIIEPRFAVLAAPAQRVPLMPTHRLHIVMMAIVMVPPVMTIVDGACAAADAPVMGHRGGRS
jgi:hypothetical protein